MKRFILTFLGCFALTAAFFFFGGYLLFESIWRLAGLIAFVLAVLICIFTAICEDHAALEKRVSELESKCSGQENKPGQQD